MSDASPAAPLGAARIAGAGSPRAGLLRAVLGNGLAVTGFVLLAIIVAAALLAPVIAPGDPLRMVARPLQWPFQNAAHPLGTDALGRDLLAGVLHGARISLTVGILASAVGTLIGLVIGALAGYFGGIVDALLSRVIEVFQTLPHLLLLITVVAFIEPTVGVISVAIGVVTWPAIARLVRAEFRSLREKEFVMAARSQGVGDLRIIFREILPNALPPVIVTASIMVASAILMEAALAFIGLGDQNVVSWGSMIGNGRDYLRTSWYLAAVPGLVIVVTVLAINLIGDGLNDAFNPRMGGER
jgi:peptide/nickel transport system permease protein